MSAWQGRASVSFRDGRVAGYGVTLRPQGALGATHRRGERNTFAFSRPLHDVDLPNLDGHASHHWSEDMTELREGGGEQIRVKEFNRDWIFEEGPIEDYLNGRRAWPGQGGGAP